jgi:hypothetical protein
MFLLINSQYISAQRGHHQVIIEEYINGDGIHIAAYRPVAKQWLYKQRPLLGKARNIHSGNNRRKVFSVVRAAAVSGQQLGEHIPAATDTNATI